MMNKEQLEEATQLSNEIAKILKEIRDLMLDRPLVPDENFNKKHCELMQKKELLLEKCKSFQFE